MNEFVAVIAMLGSGILAVLAIAYLLGRQWMLATLATVAFGALLAFTIAWFSAHKHYPPPTWIQANQICARHQGVKEVQAPGQNGAYIVCRDGYLGHTKTGGYWR